MRHAGDPQGATRVARGPGRILREAREAAGYSAEEMARRTRLQPRVIEAVEADAYERLAGTGFVKGYIRLMARELGLDPAIPLAEFDLQFSAIEPSISNFESSPPAELTSANRWIKATSVGLLLVLVVMVVAWWDRHQDDGGSAEGETATDGAQQPAADPGTPLPYAFTIVEHSTNPLEAPANWRRQSDGSAPPAEAPAAPENPPAAEKPVAEAPPLARRAPDSQSPIPGNPADEPTPAKPAPDAETAPGASQRAREDRAPEPAPDRAAAAPKPGRETSVAVGSTAPANAPVARSEAGRDPASERPDLVLHAARNESWVEITDRAGEKLWTGTVKRGGRIGVTGKPPYSVVIGNARDVDVTWRERPVNLRRTIRDGTARGTIGEPD